MTRTQQRVLLVMAALAGLIAIFLIIFLLLFNGSSHPRPVIQLHTATPLPPQSPTPPPPATPTTRPTPQARTRDTTAVRAIPDSTGAIIARLPAGLSLPIIGRSSDNAWLLVLFTASTAATPRAGAPDTTSGWVAAASVDLLGDLNQIPILAAPAPSPSPTPAPTTPPAPSPSPTPPPTPSPTPSPSPTAPPAPTQAPRPTTPARALPDLQLEDFGVVTSGASAGFVRVDIINVGQADLVGTPIDIIGIDQTGAQVLRTTTGPLTIPVGQLQTILTAYRPAQRTTLTVVINANNAISEADAPPGFDDPNNSTTKILNPLP